MRGRGARTGRRVAPAEGSEHRPATPVPLADRRRLRGSRTHSLILEALVELLESGNPRPSARRIAEKAGVAPRSVFHHFGDVSGVYLAAAELQASRHVALVEPIAPTGSVESRVGRLSHQRRELFGAVELVFLAVSARSGSPGGIDSHLGTLGVRLREQLAETLGPELAVRGEKAPVLLDALEMATGWAHWHALRIETGHSAEEAERLMAYAVMRFLP